MKPTARNFTAALISGAFYILGFEKKATKKLLFSQAILPIYFHNPGKNEFHHAIKFLKKKGFKFISLNEFEMILDGKLPFPYGAVLLTADDGWETNFENMVPIANSEKVPITIFVSTDGIESGNYWFNYVKKATLCNLGFPDKEELKRITNEERLKKLEEIKTKISLEREAMTVVQVQEIDKNPYVRIEAHSHIHPIMPQCTTQELYQDIEECKTKLENWLGRKILSFAYPNGNFGNREKEALSKFGFTSGFSNKPSIIFPHHLEDPFQIPRIGFLEGASKLENRLRMLGIWHTKTKKVFKK